LSRERFLFGVFTIINLLKGGEFLLELWNRINGVSGVRIDQAVISDDQNLNTDT
jgi:hypothetical protein